MTKPPIKLNKKQISEAIQTIPLDRIVNNEVNGLTSRQRKYAENIVLKGMNKTQAYKEAGYSDRGKPEVVTTNAHLLSKNNKVSMMIKQLQASESLKHMIIPSSLRALAIEKITELAIDEDQSARDRLKALELIGKFTDVSLFERMPSEQTIITNSDEVKRRLFESLQNAIRSSHTLTEDKKASAESLMEEIRGGKIQDAELIDDETDSESDDVPMPNDIPLSDAPPHPTPLNDHDDRAEILHNIPDNQISNPSEVPTLDEVEEEGEGVSEILKVELGVDIEMTPLDDFGSHD